MWVWSDFRRRLRVSARRGSGRARLRSCDSVLDMTAPLPETAEIASEAGLALRGSAASRAGAAAPASRSRLHPLIRACRPRQWVKNVLVIAAPGAAGVLTHPAVAEKVAFAFVCFSLLASATYLVNDVRDREEDARHPKRCRRPIAAGEVSPRSAVTLALALGVAGVGAAFAVSPSLGVVGVGYLLLTGSYSLWLRSIAVADIAAVSACFVLRAMAGAAAADVPVSRWFVMVTSFGALFLVAGKRYAELRNEGLAASTRASLRAYSEAYLRFVMILSASVATAAYCLWAFQGHVQGGLQGHGEGGLPWYEMTILPFVLWLLRYGLLIDQGAGQAPEELVLGDRFLIAMSGLWAAFFACAVYIGT